MHPLYQLECTLRAKQKWLKGDLVNSSSDISDTEATGNPQARLSAQDQALVKASVPDKIPHTYQGVFERWKMVLFAEDKAMFEKSWIALCKEFDYQRLILRYLYNTYMPIRAQWARYCIKQYRNFGIRVTSGTEASNNVKSYLLKGMSYLYRLVEAIQDMINDQERDFKDKCAADEVLVLVRY